MEKSYCPKCCKNVNLIIKKAEITRYRDVDLLVTENIAICNECSEEIFQKEMEEDNLKRLYNEYKSKVGLVKSEDIVRLRKELNLTQKEFASILGWNEKILDRYERGAIQNKEHDDALKRFMDNKNCSGLNR